MGSIDEYDWSVYDRDSFLVEPLEVTVEPESDDVLVDVVPRPAAEPVGHPTALIDDELLSILVEVTCINVRVIDGLHLEYILRLEPS